ncbi:MAG: response regulator [Oceanospirillaceae bacterium]|nr:response regulator [Oceanospirillaceae bacterium]MBT13088.1 response regulator [Oceanospirillaceae bacterium]|tara:strand:- start:11756 stop:13150 length:1395 start_codon:yes stop_codon:yes gene_type:complete
MKCALVVDDSKTAQLHLKRMLARYDLEAECASSAEEAFSYLENKPAPSIIFLDHHMDDMDGFEALKIIKANPATATIPVVMYTAQQGDVYVGQARALGALDILSKGSMKPHQLGKVLKGLGIAANGEDASASPAAETPHADPDHTDLNHSEPAAALWQHQNNQDKADPRYDQLFNEFERQSTRLREQIADESHLILGSVHSTRSDVQQNQKAIKQAETRISDIVLPEIAEKIAADQQRTMRFSNFLQMVTFVGLAVTGFALYQTSDSLSDVEHRLTELQNSVQQSPQGTGSEGASAAFGDDASSLSYGLVDVISWAMDTDFHFGYDQQPFSESRVTNISNLVYRMADAGYTGKVQLITNFGNVCLQADDAGNYALAPDDMPVADCIMLEDTNPDLSVKNLLSVALINFEQTAEPIRDGRIGLQIRSNGLQSPRFEYPAAYPEMRAGEWNDIALKNNRISIAFNY